VATLVLAANLVSTAREVLAKLRDYVT